MWVISPAADPADWPVAAGCSCDEWFLFASATVRAFYWRSAPAAGLIRIFPAEAANGRCSHVPPCDVRAVILGQDPYHGGVPRDWFFRSRRAHGYHRLRNIFKELHAIWHATPAFRSRVAAAMG
jgi:hypothetical protein